MSSIHRFETTEKLSEVVVHNGVVYLAGQVSNAHGIGEGHALAHTALRTLPTDLVQFTPWGLPKQTRQPRGRSWRKLIVNRWSCLQVPENAEGQGIEAQIVDVLQLIDQKLALAGSNNMRILSATVYLTHLKRDMEAVNQAWCAWLKKSGAGHAPARASMQVTALAKPGWDVEISVIAAVE